MGMQIRDSVKDLHLGPVKIFITFFSGGGGGEVGCRHIFYCNNECY